MLIIRLNQPWLVKCFSILKFFSASTCTIRIEFVFDKIRSASERTTKTKKYSKSIRSLKKKNESSSSFEECVTKKSILPLDAREISFNCSYGVVYPVAMSRCVHWILSPWSNPKLNISANCPCRTVVCNSYVLDASLDEEDGQRGNTCWVEESREGWGRSRTKESELAKKYLSDFVLRRKI